MEIIMKSDKVPFRQLFNLKDDLAKGRTSMVLSASFVSMITWLSTGLFYTSFLTSNDINVVEIGILAFVPYIAKCFSVFSPSILERFKKRKLVLALSRFIYYTLNLFAVTVLPYFVSDPQMKISFFIVIEFAANIIYSMFSDGYSVWHLNFIPDSVRVDYFSANTLITAFLGCGTSLAASVVADVLTGSPYEETIIVILRLIAYALGILDVIILSAPKEFPYKQATAPRLTDIFVKPIKHTPFALTMIIVAVYNFFYYMPSATLNYYLRNDIGVEYTLTSIINAFYPIFVFLFLPFWQKVIRKWGWMKAFAVAELLHVPTTLLYSFINGDNYMWVLPTVRLTQHFFGVGRNVAYANLMYINMPDTDRTNYVSFHTLVLNVATFLGIMTGTFFVSIFPDAQLNLFGFTFGNAQMLLWIQMVGQFIAPFLVFVLFIKNSNRETSL